MDTQLYFYNSIRATAMKLTLLCNCCSIFNAAVSHYSCNSSPCIDEDPMSDLSLLQTQIAVQAPHELATERRTVANAGQNPKELLDEESQATKAHNAALLQQDGHVPAADHFRGKVEFNIVKLTGKSLEKMPSAQETEKHREGEVYEGQHVASYVMGGPPRILREGFDQFNESVRAMEEFDKNITLDCSSRYGKSMLEGLRNTKLVYCDGLKSSVVCHQRALFDKPRYMCELHHIQMFGNSSRAESCVRNDVHWPSDLEFGSTEGHFLNNLQFQDTPLECSRTIDSNVLIQMPWDTGNFYEWYGDWVTMWESLAALAWNPRDTALFVVHASSRPMKMPFVEAWSRAFGDRLHTGTSEELFGDGICFANAAIVPHGGLSTTTFDGGRVDFDKHCSSPTVMASALYFESLFGTPVLKTDPEKQVTLLLRSGNRAFVDEEAAEDWVRGVLPSGWRFQTWRPEQMPMADQLAVAAKTDILIGVHGAGLTHVLFLPPNAHVVEFFCADRSGANRHFVNLHKFADEDAARSGEDYHLERDQPWWEGCQLDQNLVQDAFKKYDRSNFHTS